MGLVRWRTLFPKHRTTVADKKAYKYPYLPKGLNSDQGSQFTSTDYVELLEGNGIAISMDSRVRALDGYFSFYNDGRLHQSLGYKTPARKPH